jgi:transcriptional regulator with XRE-family HTH domain
LDRSLSSFGEAQLRALGARLRELREARSWSLKRLSREAAVSIAALQAIEAGGSNPGLLTIVSIAEALGEPVDRLIAASQAASSAVRYVHGQVTRRTGGVQHLTGPLLRPRMQALVLTLAPRKRIPGPSSARSRPLFALVLDGQVQASFADRTVEKLKKGDALHVNAEPPTAWMNSGASTARVLLVTDTRNAE